MMFVRFRCRCIWSLRKGTSADSRGNLCLVVCLRCFVLYTCHNQCLCRYQSTRRTCDGLERAYRPLANVFWCCCLLTGYRISFYWVWRHSHKHFNNITQTLCASHQRSNLPILQDLYWRRLDLLQASLPLVLTDMPSLHLLTSIISTKLWSLMTCLLQRDNRIRWN